MKTISLRFVHDVNASDPLCGEWHSGFRLPTSDTIAFFFRGKWRASVGGEMSPPLAGKVEALNYTRKAVSA